MKIRKFSHLLALFLSNGLYAQCFQIGSILADACGPPEGLNEVVRPEIGNAPVNTAGKQPRKNISIS